jgi:hypothetical protein
LYHARLDVGSLPSVVVLAPCACLDVSSLLPVAGVGSKPPA